MNVLLSYEEFFFLFFKSNFMKGKKKKKRERERRKHVKELKEISSNKLWVNFFK